MRETIGTYRRRRLLALVGLGAVVLACVLGVRACGGGEGVLTGGSGADAEPLFTSELTRFHNGFKLFYEEDTNLMSPRQVLALRPPPDIVVYE